GVARRVVAELQPELLASAHAAELQSERLGGARGAHQRELRLAGGQALRPLLELKAKVGNAPGLTVRRPSPVVLPAGGFDPGTVRSAPQPGGRRASLESDAQRKTARERSDRAFEIRVLATVGDVPDHGILGSTQ